MAQKKSNIEIRKSVNDHKCSIGNKKNQVNRWKFGAKRGVDLTVRGSQENFSNLVLVTAISGPFQHLLKLFF